MLTSKERQILQYFMQGYTYREIAQHVFLSESSVRDIIYKYRQRYQCKNHVVLALFIERNNLIPSPVNQGA